MRWFRLLTRIVLPIVLLCAIWVRGFPASSSSAETGAINRLPAPAFSQQRGFYDGPFELAITSGISGASIRYTTDGSSPSIIKGVDYTGPIPISQTTTLRAAVFNAGNPPSRAATHTFIFLDDVVRQSPNGRAPEGWPEVWGLNTVDYGMDPEVVNDPKYRDTLRHDLKTIPSFSIVMDLEDLFGSDTGIYSNALGDGRDWERPCSVELVFPDGRKGFQIDAGIRVRGGFSRIAANPKHAFRLFFRKEYGEGKLRYPLFGDEGAAEFDHIDLRTFQNYSWSFLGDSKGVFVRDQNARDTQMAMGQPAKRGFFHHLYLNGQYWGLYNTDERSEASYGETYLGGRKEDFDVIKVEPFIYKIEATDGNMDAWIRLYHQVKSGLESESAYQRVQGNNPDGSPNPAYENLLDVGNLIDYMLLIFYGGNLDAPVSSFLNNNRPNNFYAIRDRRGREGFRFLAHDSEHTLLNALEDRTGPYLAGETSVAQSNPQWIFQKLEVNAEFRMRVADHVQRHFFNDGALTPESAIARFENRIREIDRAVVGESARWGDAKRAKPFTRDAEWLAAVNEIRANFFPRRTTIVLEQLRGKGLYPAVEAPVFSQHGGRVTPGDQLAISARSGAILYTMDGSDPRLSGGAVSAVARKYESPLPLVESTHLKARSLEAGIWSALTETFFTLRQDVSPLIISEIMYHPPDENGVDGDEFEFIELSNIGPETLDLSGVRLAEGIRYAFPDGTRIYPDERIVLVSNQELFSVKYPDARIDGVYTGKLSNAGDTVILLNASGGTVHSVKYSDALPWPESPDGAGYSLELKLQEQGVDLDHPANWQASAKLGGTPGDDERSPVPQASGPVVINEIQYLPGVGGIEFIELKNVTDKPLELYEPGHPERSWMLDGVDFKFPPGQIIPAFGIAVITASEPSVFRSRYRIPSDVAVFGPFFGVLANRGERLRLTRPGPRDLDGGDPSDRLETTVDEVRYWNSPPWPLFINAAAGGSIERIDARSHGNIPANWRASPGHPSPGFENHRNRAPTVNAGADLRFAATAFPFQTHLDGVSIDDGFPAGPDRLQVLWTTASGPSTVSFSPRNRDSTDVWFSTPGTFLLRLVAFDGLRFGHDSVSVNIAGPSISPIGDFDWDGKSDVLFQHSDGSLAAWFMNGAELRGSSALQPTGPGTGDWRVAGVGDFDRDGHGDLLFQHLNGALSVWIMDGSRLRVSGSVSPTSPDDPRWRVAALADFNGDGATDFLFQHENGALVFWMMDGVIFTSNEFPLPSHPGDKAWRVAAARDFNRDGNPDILLQHLDGTLAVWEMDGIRLKTVSFLNPQKPESQLWRVVSASDLDGDENVDLVFQDSENGQLAVWFLDKLNLRTAQMLVPSDPGKDWKVVGP